MRRVLSPSSPKILLSQTFWGSPFGRHPPQKSPLCRGDFCLLLETKFDAFGLFGLPSFADNGLEAALTLGNRFFKTHLRLLQRHNTTLKDFAVEATDNILISFTLIFSSNFNCHTERDYITDRVKRQYLILLTYELRIQRTVGPILRSLVIEFGLLLVLNTAADAKYEPIAVDVQYRPPGL